MTATIAAIIRRDDPQLTENTPIRDAAAALVAAQCSGAAVVDETGALIGMLTQKDCFRPALNASYYRQWTGMVRDRMTRGATTIDETADLVTAAQMFLDHPHRLLPVVSSGRLTGVLHRSDVLAALLALG